MGDATRDDFPRGQLGDRAWEIYQTNGGYGLAALGEASDRLRRENRPPSLLRRVVELFRR